MKTDCLRAGRAISFTECTERIIHTTNAADLRICNACERGRALARTASRDVRRSANERPPGAAGDIRAFGEAELWAELHRRNPKLWKKF